MDRVCVNNDAGTLDQTDSANDDAVSDVSVGRTGSNPVDSSAVYFGMLAPYNELAFSLGTPGTGGTVTWKYWDGSVWQPLAVTDGTDHFRNSGVNTVSFTPPSNWATRQHPTSSSCPGQFYYAYASTNNLYTVAPLATKISAQPFNLRVKVQTEAGAPLAGLASTAFSFSQASDVGVYGFRETGSGYYEWSLSAAAADTNYNLRVAADGYVAPADRATGTLTSARTTLDAPPVTVAAAFKVTAITAEGGAPLAGATVRTGDAFGVTCAEAAGAWSCIVPLLHTGVAIRVEKAGYVTHSGTSFASDRTSSTDAQRAAAVSGVLHTIKVTVSGEASLAGISWEIKAGSADFTGAVPAATVGNVAYFAQDPGDGAVVVRAAKVGAAGDTGAAFTPSAASQAARSITLAPAATTPAPPPGSSSAAPSPSGSASSAPEVSLAGGAVASSPATAGPVFPVSWSSSDGASMASVSIWALEDGRAPRLLHVNPRPSGAIAFYGSPGSTYGFAASAEDSLGRVADPVAGVADAETTTFVDSDRVLASGEALGALGGSLEAFYVHDEDGDGQPDGFVDPNGRLDPVRPLTGAAQSGFLLRDREADLLWFWDLLTNRLVQVERELTSALAEPRRAGALLKVTVLRELEGLSLLEVDDRMDGREVVRVERADGTEVPAERHWRDGPKVLILDDGSDEYIIFYQSAAAAPLTGTLAPALAATGALVVLVLAWVAWPSAERVGRRTYRQGMGWSLRACLACQRPLPRGQRFVRALHRCMGHQAPAPGAARTQNPPSLPHASQVRRR